MVGSDALGAQDAVGDPLRCVSHYTSPIDANHRHQLPSCLMAGPALVLFCLALFIVYCLSCLLGAFFCDVSCILGLLRWPVGQVR